MIELSLQSKLICFILLRLKSVAVKTAMTMTVLLMQHPHAKRKNNVSYLTLWHQDVLVIEGRTLQTLFLNHRETTIKATRLLL